MCRKQRPSKAAFAPISIRGPRTPVAANPKPYNPRHPEQTLLYRTGAENFETWRELASAGWSVPACLEPTT